MNYRSVVVRRTCRACCGFRLSSINDFGEIYASDFTSSPVLRGERCAIDLVRCEECSLVQLRHTFPQDSLYKHYWYRSGTNSKIVADLKSIAKSVHVAEGDVVLDIGANDGTGLSFYPPGVKRVACEPADNLQEELKKVTPHIIHGLWEARAYKHKPAKVITAIGMLYDSDDPLTFLQDITKCLDDDGTFIAQLVALKGTIEKNDVGNILCFEHLNFFSYRSLRMLFEKAGLEIYKVEENDTNGLSYRLYARKYKTGSIAVEEDVIDWPQVIERMETAKRETMDFIKSAKMGGARIFGAMASTKTNGIMQYYGLDSSLIEGIGEIMPQKIGKYCIGSGIPIVPEEYMLAHADIIWVGAFAFKDYLLEKYAGKLKEGCVIAFSAPDFYVTS